MTITVTPSLLKTWGKCPQQVYFFHVLRLKLPPRIATEFGSSLHTAILERDQASRIATGRYLPIGELQEAFANDFDRRILDTDPDDRDALDMGGHVQARDTLQRWGLSALDRYNENRDALSGRAIERAFEIPFGDGSLKGRIDIDVSDGAFRDLKTRDLSRPRAKRTSITQVAYDWQFAAYAAAKASIDKSTDVVSECVTVYKRENPLIESLSVVRTPENHLATESYAASVQRSIAAGIFTPVDKSSPAGWVCSARYCGAYPATLPDGSRGCQWGERAAVSVPVTRE